MRALLAAVALCAAAIAPAAPSAAAAWRAFFCKSSEILMKCVLAIALAVMLAATADAAAQTSSERQACKPDVFRLCTAAEIAAAALGDRSGIYACFRVHRSEVSPACDRILKNHGY